MILNFHTLPPAEALEGMDDLQAIIEEYQTTLGEWRGCNAEYEQLKTALDDARREDGEAAIKAYREGKTHPGKRREQKVLKAIEEVQERQKVREGALASIERDVSGVAQKTRDEIPKLEAAIEADNEELRELLDQVHTIQQRRAHRKGLIHWLREMPGTYQAITYTSSGVTEDVARNVLLGSTQPPVVDPDEGTVRYLVG